MRMIVAFQKTEQVRHIGHLDIQRAVQRALRRSGIPVRYTEGFHPHTVLSFASPLPVGASGAFELMEFALAAECDPGEVLSSMQNAMPPSLPVFDGRAVPDSHPKLAAMLKMADYRATFDGTPAAHQMADAVGAFLEQREIIALRKTKSGEKPCDIRPMIYQLHVEANEHAGTANQTEIKKTPDFHEHTEINERAEINEQTVAFVFRVSLTEKETLKPDLLLQTLSRHAGVALPAYRLHRQRLLAELHGKPVNLMER